MNKAAQALGRLAKGKPKTLTAGERDRRRQRLANLNKTRPNRSENARKAVAARWYKHHKVMAARAMNATVKAAVKAAASSCNGGASVRKTAIVF